VIFEHLPELKKEREILSKNNILMCTFFVHFGPFLYPLPAINCWLAIIHQLIYLFGRWLGESLHKNPLSNRLIEEKLFLIDQHEKKGK
jgi:hypothetical protein